MSETSPPARVAWIETRLAAGSVLGSVVATREGGVDRNVMLKAVSTNHTGSPPARVAWIETP